MTPPRTPNLFPEDPSGPPRRRAGGGAGRSGGGDSHHGPAGQEFSGPILGGDVPIPSSRQARRRARRASKRRRSLPERLLRGVIILLALLLVVVGIGYGYFRYEWAQVHTQPCPECAAVVGGQPYNVLVIGSDTRQGETAAQAQQFGSASNAAGQRSDTIKIVHVDPAAGTASTLSIPRDTFVTLSGMPKGTQVSTVNKINAAFNGGADSLVTTIQNTFGIPISHWISINFFGLMDAVNALGGTSMDVPQPVRDYGDCNGNGVYSSCSGLNLPTTGCQTLNGAQALSLSRSRHFEYLVNGSWQSDGSGDLGRIQRQNLVIEAVVDKAKSTYNPIRAASFIASMTHDVEMDSGMSASALLALATRYHAFSGSALTNYLLPTSGGYYAPYGEDIEVVDQPQAAQTIASFLGTAPQQASTPPLDATGQPIPAPAASVPGSAVSGSTTASVAGAAAASGSTTAPVAGAAAGVLEPMRGPAAANVVAASGSGQVGVPTVPAFDPKPC